MTSCSLKGTLMNVRLGICGSAGTGKSSLGIALSKELDIPFLASKDVTLEILNRDGYEHGCGVQVEKFLAQEGRQEALLKRTVADQSKTESFVTDRTVVDLAAYAVAELHSSDPKKVSSLVEKCKCETHIGIYSHLIVCPWGLSPLKNNARRTLNPWYQFIIHSLGLSLMDMWGVKFSLLKSVEEKARVAEVLKIIGR